MNLRSCILTLLIVWPVLEALGVWFYQYIQKTRPQPLPENDPRSKYVKHFRFLLYVVLMPFGVTLALALIGALDPIYHLVRAMR
jgi:hypothetical protein